MKMRISHIVRGSEWLPSTPLHIALWNAFGWERPEYIHLPVILAPTGNGKLSKRSASDGALVMAKQFIDAAIDPNAANVWMLQGLGLLKDDRLDWRKAITEFQFANLPSTKPQRYSLPKLRKVVARVGQNASEREYEARVEKSKIAAKYDAKVVSIVSRFMKSRSITRDGYGDKSYEKFMDFLREEWYNTDRVIETSKRDIVYQTTVVNTFLQLLQQRDEIGDGTIDFLLESVTHQYGRKALGVLRYAVTHRHISVPVREAILLLGVEATAKRMVQYVNNL
jgi:glutamyl-tRNA synthetase